MQKELGKPFPQDPIEQLFGGIRAVFDSWETERAIIYRRLNRIPDDWGTAVNVQTMVFGNMGDDCGTGVAFTRDPGTGEPVLLRRIPDQRPGRGRGGRHAHAPAHHHGTGRRHRPQSLEEAMPAAFKELLPPATGWRSTSSDMQDLEFTIERGKLFMLQTRNGKRTALASIRIAIDMVDEGLIDAKTALSPHRPRQPNQLLAPVFDPKEKAAFKKDGKLMTKGLNAGPGAAAGRIALSAEAGRGAGQGRPRGAVPHRDLP